MLRALYEVQRTQVILAKLNPATAKHVPDSLAYAYSERMCPYWDGQDSSEDPFDKAYDIGREFLSEVVKLCEGRWLSGQSPTFYQLEDEYGRSKRMSLIAILRYAALSTRFDDAFFTAILSKCPAEAKHLTAEFRLSEIGIR